MQVDAQSDQPMPGKRKIRVLFIDHTAVLSGGELAMLEALREIDPAEMECAVVLGADGPLVSVISALVPVYVIPVSRRVLETRKDTLTGKNLVLLSHIAASVPYIFKLRRFIRAWQPDIVHTNSLKADLLGGFAARLAGARLIWHVRDRIEDDYLPPAAVLAVRWLSRWLPHAILGCSQSVLDSLHLPASKPQTVVYSGIRLEDYAAPIDDTADVAPQPIRHIGIVGRLAPWKGQHIFLESAATLHRRYPHLRFVIIGSAMFGEDAYETRLREQVRATGLTDVVEFKGFVREVQREFCALDVVVHASTSAEPFGQTIVQGMAAGKPVVAAEGGGASEIIRDGVDGLLVRGGDSALLTAALERLLVEPGLAERLGRMGRERVREKFTIQRTVKDMKSAIHAVCGPAFDPRTRVLFYNTTARVSGGEIVMINILHGLDRSATDVFVATPRGPLSERMTELGQATIDVPELRLRFTRDPRHLALYVRSLLRTAGAFRGAVNQVRPHLIHANSIRAGLVATLATVGLGVRVQWHIHDNLPPRLLSSAIRLAAFCSPRVRFIAVSQSTSNNFAGLMWRRSLSARTSVLLNAIDPQVVFPDPSKRPGVRRELGLAEEDLCIVHVGQIARRKDQLGAVRAFAKAFKDTPHARLLFIGSPVFEGGAEYLAEIQREIESRGLDQQVRLLGQRNDVSAIMQSADLVLLNSLQDPCPISILEGMAVGAPILASNVDGIPELLVDGESAWLAEPGNIDHFSARMTEVLSLPAARRAEVGKAARRAVELRPMTRYIAQYAAILEQNRPHPKHRNRSRPTVGMAATINPGVPESEQS
jgi:glycosyltransferase involved in cell wall biosynthesis